MIEFDEKTCIDEVKRYIKRLAPKVAEKLKQRGYNVSNINLHVAEGTVIVDKKLACAATNPETNPVTQLYSCTCWEHFNEPSKIFTVAHELVHAFGIKDEYIANTIALEVVREEK